MDVAEMGPEEAKKSARGHTGFVGEPQPPLREPGGEAEALGDRAGSLCLPP